LPSIGANGLAELHDPTFFPLTVAHLDLFVAVEQRVGYLDRPAAFEVQQLAL